MFLSNFSHQDKVLNLAILTSVFALEFYTDTQLEKIPMYFHTKHSDAMTDTYCNSVYQIIMPDTLLKVKFQTS